jgi:hypothetical protein
VTPAQARRNRRTLLLIALVAIAPVVASYVIYYWFPRDKQVNYGELLATPAPSTTKFDWTGKWTIAVAAPGACDASCMAALYATRQARTMQGREMDRVRRVWFVTDGTAPAPTLLAQHPDLELVRNVPDAMASWPAGSQRIYLVDPLGNLVLAWPREPDIKKVGKDVERLLRASRIG